MINKGHNKFWNSETSMKENDSIKLISNKNNSNETKQQPITMKSNNDTEKNNILTAGFKDRHNKTNKKEKYKYPEITKNHQQKKNYDENRSKKKHKYNETPILESIMWNALETFKPGVRASMEDTICCKLVACESSRISKKLGGSVKYFINNYFQ